MNLWEWGQIETGNTVTDKREVWFWRVPKMEMEGYVKCGGFFRIRMERTRPETNHDLMYNAIDIVSREPLGLINAVSAK